ncbi:MULTISPECIES: DUF503 domain-containing protein [Caldanaerobacter]|uniref:DUF503 domain-containing protein n=2 Tax=Caldanaerobacter subterraneus TaxID=911092 RepID=Q8R853_CALS4|nr:MULTISPECIES: DUF503 domain-containing protein [Caldanaerobacter]AAM25335.1 conserved hypothetical protein [Caldanaerobacter subterraneus subsp. tengcongensis MB4]MCS3915062.1 uncharacterized protein YlxP (DUF503 family) [Caldanaerobacter subterraneus subsp. tengcongensis MB4]MDI3518455.1 uncharacterized protein [Caldanaerobacter sp.]MDK2794457.1 uncharacterized protein [Caldanaerobacter sp.]NNG67463.1 DUF503 domain-containing protein [Caldanaerobacter subterraneus]
MVVSYCKLYLRANWVHSLKEKRMITKSIIGKVKSHYNVSISEVENQDAHKSIVIGFSVCGSDALLTNKIVQEVIDYIEQSTDAYIEDIEMDTIKV